MSTPLIPSTPPDQTLQTFQITHPVTVIDSTPQMVEGVYKMLAKNLPVIRQRLGRPLTLTEKIVLGHLADPQGQELDPGESYLLVNPDRIALQDATAQMALLQFAHAGRARAAVPTTVHCDHLIRAHVGADADLIVATKDNREVYGFLSSVSQKYGLGFWKPGSGIIHQVVLEHYAFPGGLMIGTDSHTPNAGGLGMIAAGVGGADAVDVMAGFPWEVKYPKKIGVRLTGQMSGWTSPKDVILKLCSILTVRGGTNSIVEFFGPGCATISATGKATICNMGAEHGATTSIFPYDQRMGLYLRGTGRADLAVLADGHTDLLTADPEIEADPERYFDRVIEIDLTTLEPYVVGPHTPDLARSLSEIKAAVTTEDYPDRLSAALVGSCTNSSYEDISRAALVAQQALDHGLKMQTNFMITPGSEQVRATLERDGQLDTLAQLGGKILANACGPCIGQWQRDDLTIQPVAGGLEPAAESPKKARNSIINSFNRNFPRRNDGNPDTLSFIASPEIVIAYGLAGRLSFNPLTDTIEAPDGTQVRLDPPPAAPDLPAEGFVLDVTGFVPPAEHGDEIAISVSPDSNRLALLAPFPAWDGQDFLNAPVLLKVKGKCTTDHISPAGPWLRFRGHLDHVSDNMFTGAINAFTGEAGTTYNALTGEHGQSVPQVARAYKAAGMPWIAVGDENYGEGSSREHAAMSPRYLGAAAIIARSFARIHESNLKKQGVLPLSFADSADYDKIREDDHVDLSEVGDLAPGAPVMLRIRHADGTSDFAELKHTMSEEQIGWFKAGSALNLLARKPESGA